MSTFYFGYIYIHSEGEDGEYDIKTKNNTLFHTEEDLVKDIMEGGHFVDLFSTIYDDGVPDFLLGEDEEDVEWEDHSFNIKTGKELQEFCSEFNDDYTITTFVCMRLNGPPTKRTRDKDTESETHI